MITADGYVRVGDLPYRVQGYVGDTAVLAKNICPDVSKGAKGAETGIPLAWVAQAYTDTEAWKPPKKSKGRPKFESYEQLAVYNAKDCANTAKAFVELQREFAAQGLNPAQLALDMQHQLLAVDMQRVGLPIDMGRLRQLEKDSVAEMERLQARFTELVGRPVGFNRPADLAQILFDQWGLPKLALGKPDKMGRQQASTADNVLNDLEGIAAGLGFRDYPHIAEGVSALRRIRKLGQILKLYVWGWGRLVRNGWIHPSWRACATVTGRYSSSPNFQNLPHDLKKLVVAPPGWVLVSSDYAALEQRIMAAIAGGDLFTFVNKPDDDSRKFDPDYDCHSHVARLVYGDLFVQPWLYLDAAQFTEAGLAKEGKRKQKEIRNATKRIVYARNYGSGVETIHGIVKEDNPRAQIDEVRATVDAYDRRFPELPAYREQMHRQVNDPNCRALFSRILGRRRWFPGEGTVLITDAANFGIQSTGSDIMNLRMVELVKQLPKDAAIIAQVHDSVTVLCRKEDGESVRQLMDAVLPCSYDFGKGLMLFDAKAAIGESWDQV